MSDIQYPPCIDTPDDRWRFPVALDDCTCTTVAIHHERFDAGAFAQLAIHRPEHLNTAATKRQAEYLGGRVCARRSLERVGGPGGELPVDAERVPQWPAGFCGSITHSKGFAAAVSGRRRRWQSLGLDLEHVLEEARAERLAHEILTEAERTRFSDWAPAVLVTLVFSFKESLFKALYPLTRRRFYFQDAEVIDLTYDGQAQLALRANLSEEWRSGQHVGGQFIQLGDHLLSLVVVPAAR